MISFIPATNLPSFRLYPAAKLMDVHIQFCNTPILRDQPFPLPSPHAGARVEFFGNVRATESNAPIRGLRYEIYEAMAEKQIKRILADVQVEHPCSAVSIVHRHGAVLVGESALYVGICAKHRKEAFAMLSAFMDRMKREVPIWKVEVLV